MPGFPPLHSITSVWVGCHVAVSAYGDCLGHLSPHQPLTKQLSPVTHLTFWILSPKMPTLISTCNPLNNSPKCPCPDLCHL